MSGPPPEVLVVGLGAMGSAASYHLARRGVRVLGLDRFAPPHARGSSHGESRIIREAYFEDPRYVPLVQRASRLWEALQEDAGRPLLRRTGALMLGEPGGELVAGALRSARTHRLPHERWSAEEIRARFPVFRPSAGVTGVYEERAGILDPEGCVRAHLEGARARGAELRTGETVLSWRVEGAGVEVTTERARYRAGQLVLCAGPWLPALLPGLPLQVERQVMLWFAPRATPERFHPARFPVFLWETGPGELFYGVPDLGAGVKAARHHGGDRGRVDTIDDAVREADVAGVRAFLERHLPAAAGPLLRGSVCRYTNAPGGRFLIDRHPEHARVQLVSPCSGHGFKFASAIGEAVAARVLGEADALDLSLFGLRRPGAAG